MNVKTQAAKSLTVYELFILAITLIAMVLWLIFFLFSNDANHYGEDFDNHPYGLNEAAHIVAVANDKRIADQAFRGTLTETRIKNFSNELWPEAGKSQDCPLWCGRYAIVFGY